MTVEPVPTYKGTPLDQLRIEAIEWSDESVEHIRTRNVRKGPEETNIEPEWATEAALDSHRIAAVTGNAPETASLKLIGMSVSLQRLLKVWIWTDYPTGDVWQGASACLANPRDERRYWRSRNE